VDLADGVGITRNVSVGGIYFVTERPHAPGQSIVFRMQFEALQAERPLQLHCSGTVLRVEPQGSAIGVAARIESYQIGGP
jgi:hypothetical protein